MRIAHLADQQSAVDPLPCDRANSHFARPLLGLGACCVCETTEGVRNMIMLDKRAQVSGHGWGCFVCGLATDGANAVLCDPCLERFREDQSVLTMACRGYPASDGRVAIAELEPFTHNEWLHREPQRLVEGDACEHAGATSGCRC